MSTLSRLLSSRALLVLLLALLALLPTLACTAAPLENRACAPDAGPDGEGECATGYVCCRSTNRCLTPEGLCPCSVVTLVEPAITTNGHPLAGEAEPTEMSGQLAFNAPSGQWVSYPFTSNDEPPSPDQVSSAVTPAGDGFHVNFAFESPMVPITFEGFGLTYRIKDECIDGSNYSGVQFDFAGNLGGRTLMASVSSADDVTRTKDHDRGTCLDDPKICYGPTYPLPDTDGTQAITIPFNMLYGGKPHDGVDAHRIVNVQWQLTAPPHTIADFTIQNLKFY